MLKRISVYDPVNFLLHNTSDYMHAKIYVIYIVSSIYCVLGRILLAASAS